MRGMKRGNPETWLAIPERRKRRADAVNRALAVLGFAGPRDRGAGHLYDLYMAGYEHGLRDAYAFTALQAADWLDEAHGRFDVLFLARDEDSPW